MLYLIGYTLPKEFLAILYTLSALSSHIASFSFILWLGIIVPLVILLPIRKIIIPLCILCGSLLTTLILLDALVFLENKFHISLLMLTILGWKTWGFGIFYFVIILLFSSLMGKWISDKFLTKRHIILGVSIVLLEVTLILATHGMHIWADAVYYTPITRFTTNLPLFYPTTARRYLEKRGFIDIEENRKRNLLRTLESKSGSLNYPLRPLICSKQEQPLNAVIILIDALRADVVTPETTPHLFHMQDSALTFTNHFSGGNSTRMGVFSLFYGLPSTYWKYFEGTQRTPVLINKLQEEQYQLGIFSSAQLNRPTSLDRTAFANIKDLRMQTNSKNQQPYARDSAITEQWQEWLDQRDTAKPFFGFLFYDAPCGRDFPPLYQSYYESLITSSKKMEKGLAKYLTATYYTDSLIQIIVNNLKENHLLKNTIVIITADHGEEFDDNKLGYTGHGSSYSSFQLHVPLLVYWPDKAPHRFTHRTSHNDIPATLIQSLFECENPSSDYCSGQDLFNQKSWEWLIVGSYYNFAILEKNQITVNYPGGYFEVRDQSYQVVSNKKINKNILSSAINETKRFFTH